MHTINRFVVRVQIFFVQRKLARLTIQRAKEEMVNYRLRLQLMFMD